MLQMIMFREVVNWVSWIENTVTFQRQSRGLGFMVIKVGFMKQRWGWGEVMGVIRGDSN